MRLRCSHPHSSILNSQTGLSTINKNSKVMDEVISSCTEYLTLGNCWQIRYLLSLLFLPKHSDELSEKHFILTLIQILILHPSLNPDVAPRLSSTLSPLPSLRELRLRGFGAFAVAVLERQPVVHIHFRSAKRLCVLNLSTHRLLNNSGV